jgi:hypothetical protein
MLPILKIFVVNKYDWGTRGIDEALGFNIGPDSQSDSARVGAPFSPLVLLDQNFKSMPPWENL